MGLTMSDRRKMFYRSLIKEGFSHEEALKQMPKGSEKEISKSFIESHYGVSDKTFFIGLIIIMSLFIFFLTFFI